jgi:hypothetical protein
VPSVLPKEQKREVVDGDDEWMPERMGERIWLAISIACGAVQTMEGRG